jgi:glutamyl-tRNA synthetase
MTNLPIRVRFAPSPTGRLHIGGGRTALYNYLLARQTGGQFILRFEDTDRARYQPETEKEIIDGLHWLGIDWDEGPDKGGPHAPYSQSGRKDLYLAHAEKLIASGHAYRCFCTAERLAELRKRQQETKATPRYDGLCRSRTPDDVAARLAAGEPHVIRFKMPGEGSVTCVDRIRGDIVVENANLDDSILVKSDGWALYHLAAMVDDHEMRITHVFRSSEWLPSFPLHVHIYRAFGWEQPEWVHLSVFLKPSGKGKMSKRESAEMAADGQSIFLTDLEGLGYLPEAVNNWIALMGWSYDDRTEFFTMDDLISKFSLDKLNPAPAAINFSKFDHFNGLHIRALDPDDLAERLLPFFHRAGFEADLETLRKITPIIQERVKTLDDAPEIAGFFFLSTIDPTLDDLIPRKTTREEAAAIAAKALAILEVLPDLAHDTTNGPLRAMADEMGFSAGQVFGVLRGAVTGQSVSPPLLETMEILGKGVILQRVEAAVAALGG